MIELSVTVKGDTETGDDCTYKQKFLIHDIFEMMDTDPVIKGCIEQTLANAKITPDDIRVRALMVVK